MTYVHVVQCQLGAGEEARVFQLFFGSALSLEELTQALVRDHIVAGDRLRTVADGRGGQMIRSREPFALGIAGLANIQPPRCPVWEPEE